MSAHIQEKASLQVVRGWLDLELLPKSSVVAVGNFDGVHLGHQSVFSTLRHVGLEYGLPTVAVTFDPKPLEYLCPDRAPARLMRFGEQYDALRGQVDYVWVLPFNRELAAMSPALFARRVLDVLGAKVLVQGEDFRFGHCRAGDLAWLRDHGYVVHVQPSHVIAGDRVSSTKVRERLKAGDFTGASVLLGRPYHQTGRVIHGAKLGRQLGFPTANVAMRRLVSPLHGVYVVEVLGLDDNPLPGVANVGTRPVIQDNNDWLLEVFLFDFDRDIYGERITVRYLKHLRDERYFESLEALKAQMRCDCLQALDFLGLAPH